MNMNSFNPKHIAEGTYLRQYKADGFLVIDDILSPQEVSELSFLVEEHPHTSSYRDTESILHLIGITTLLPAFLELARHRRLLAILESLIGPDIILMHSKLTAKPLRQGKGPFSWHQDGAFYPHTNADVPAVMVMLDDATPDNGCMYMVRGSHRLGYLDHADADGWFLSECQDRVWERETDQVVEITPRAGGISIHSPLMLHSSPPNRSGKARRGLTYAYRAADAYQLGENIWPETGLVVQGSYHSTVRCDQHPIRLPRFRPGCRLGDHGSAWHQIGDFARQENLKQGLSESGRRETCRPAMRV